jgi:hypothetical protein
MGDGMEGSLLNLKTKPASVRFKRMLFSPASLIQAFLVHGGAGLAAG